MKKLALIAIVLWSSIQAMGGEVRRTLDVNAFSTISLDNAYHVYIRRGHEQEVVVIGEESDIARLEANVRDGELSFDRNNRSLLDRANTDEIKIFITVVTLRGIEVSGAVHLESKNRLDVGTFHLEVSGACEIDLELDASHVNVEVSGASDVDLSGRARSSNIEISGASDLDASNLQTNRTELEASGACNVKVYTTDQLTVEASGASDVSYRGNPELDVESSYASSIKHIE